jgi:hypothetical protein
MPPGWHMRVTHSDRIERRPKMVPEARAEVQISVNAYTDETGNTGLNLFDEGQPCFWTGTLLTPVDLDRLDPGIHRACLERAGCAELHGNQLGLSGIEKIAGKLELLLYRYRMRFVFTRVDKKHLAGTKFVDTLMDSGINEAVSNLHYGVRFHRLYLAQAIVALLTIEDREEFWEVYAKADTRGFQRILMGLQGRVETYINDPRTRQLLLDAIAWALANPEPLLEGTRSEMDSPNVVALTLLIEILHQLNNQHGLVIGTFIHDEQKQFGKWLKTAYDLSRNWGSARATSPLALITDLKEMSTFVGEFRTVNSKHSFGLQILDVVLWLVKRFIDDPEAVHGKCRDLAEYVFKDGYISEFSHGAMIREVVAGFAFLEALPLTAEKERRGRELLAEIEARRLERMRASLAGKETAVLPPEVGVVPVRDTSVD